MSKESLNFVKVLSVFCATIIGAGIFVLPYIILKIGFILFFTFLIILSFLVIIIHRLLGKIVVGTEEIHSIPGYTEKYLGSKFKNFSLFISSIRIVGVLLIYILLGGQFLYALFNPYFGGSATIYIIIFFIVSSIIIYKKNNNNSWLEIDIIGILMVILIFLIKGWPVFKSINLLGIPDVSYSGLAYGILIFALWGLPTVPRLYGLVRNNEEEYKKVINWGIILSAVFYLLFAVIIFRVSGVNTSSDALSGFSSIIGGNLVELGFVFGLIVILTSFLASGFSLKEIFHKDAMLSKPMSWLLVCFLPFSLLLIKFRDFVSIMSGIGAFLYTAEAIIIVFVYRKFFYLKFGKKPPRYTSLLLALFSVITIFEFWYFFIK